MQSFDPALETRILKTLLDNKQGSLLSTLNQEWFGMPTTKEIWSRIEILKTNGKTIPSSATMATDPVLSEAAHTLLKGSVSPLTEAEVEGAIEQMNRYREGRVIWKMVEKIADVCKVSNPDLTMARAQIETCLKNLQIPSNDKDILSYGHENERALERYETLMEQDLKDIFIPTGFSNIDMAQGGLARGRVYTIGAPSGGGKCFARDTLILMYDGTLKKVQDLAVGDMVMGPDSSSRRLVGLAHGTEEMFEISPLKGESFVVNRSHLLSLRRTDSRWGQRGKIINISVNDYLDSSANFKSVTKLYRTGVEFPEKETAVDPYVLGVYLGDGSRHNKKITSNKPEIIEHLQKYAASSGCQLTTRDSNECSQTHYFSFGSTGNSPDKNFILEEFKRCVVGENKKVPAEYLINSRDKRLKLLAGLLDTDGYLHHNFYEIISKFEPLKDDILYLARSLGFAAYCKEKFVKTKKGTQKYYRINISGNVDEIPVLVRYKKAEPRKQIKEVTNVGFTLKSKGVGEYFGFELDGTKDRLFLLGDFTVTHNSTLVNSMAINMYRKASKSVGYFSFEMNPDECLLRTQANVTRIPSERFQLRKLTPDERKKSDKMFAQFLAHGEKNNCRLDYHCPSDDINIAQLFTQAEIFNYDVVVVDYINLMAPVLPKAALWENIGEAFRLAKRWAEKTQKIVIMLVQVDEETGALKYAKSIKHHSDGVWVWEWGDTEKETGLVNVKQVKLRNLKPSNFELQAEFEFCSFTEIPVAMAPAPTAAKSMNL